MPALRASLPLGANAPSKGVGAMCINSKLEPSLAIVHKRFPWHDTTCDYWVTDPTSSQD